MYIGLKVHKTLCKDIMLYQAPITMLNGARTRLCKTVKDPPLLPAASSSVADSGAVLYSLDFMNRVLHY